MGVCMGKKKRKKIQLAGEENSNKGKEKRGHVHQTSGARFIRTNNIVKNGKVRGSQGWLTIVGRNKQKKEGMYRFNRC